MTKYRVELTRTVRQGATLYVDANSAEEAEAIASSDHAIWHDQRVVKNTLEAHAQRSEDVDRRCDHMGERGPPVCFCGDCTTQSASMPVEHDAFDDKRRDDARSDDREP
jgi:hypothetical protein